MIPETVPAGSTGLETYKLAPGITGFAVEDDGIIYIPYIRSDNPGKGHVGKFIDGLDQNTAFSSVLNAKLAGMLSRRGWLFREIFVEEMGEDVPFWFHPGSGK